MVYFFIVLGCVIKGANHPHHSSGETHGQSPKVVGGAEKGEGAPAVAEIEEPGGTRAFLRITPDVRSRQPKALDGVDIKFSRLFDVSGENLNDCRDRRAFGPEDALRAAAGHRKTTTKKSSLFQRSSTTYTAHSRASSG